MKGILFCFLFVIGFTSCHHHRDAWNPYLHSKHKPSEEIKKGYVKQDHWLHNKRHLNWFMFKRKKHGVSTK
ncbi:MAG TPA: hypothetical protein VNZ86_16630 [Bacteroidia bacterium]|nr:hypothetical protein [Bacteroidia bacterium]